MVDVPRPAPHLAAPRHDRLHHLRPPRERGFVGRGDPLADGAQLERADPRHHVIRERKVGDHGDAPQKSGLEHPQQVGAESLGQGRGMRTGGGIGAQLQHGVGAHIARHQDDRVFEIDVAPLAILEHPLVEHLVEEILHPRMRLLHLVEQHHAVGPAAHRLGQHAPFPVADIPRRRTHQQRNLVLLLELAHVDDRHVPLPSEQEVGQSQGRFRLPHAARPREEKHPHRAPRIGEPRPGGADPLGDAFKRLRLTDDPRLESLPEVEHAADLVGHHPPHRNAGPTAHHLGDRLPVDGRDDEGMLPLHRGQFLLQGHQPLPLGLAPGERRSRACAMTLGDLPVEDVNLPHEPRFGGKPGLQRLHLHRQRGTRGLELADLPGMIPPQLLLALEDGDRGRQRVELAAGVFDRRGRGHLPHRHPGAGGVEEAHGLVGQLPARNVTPRELDTVGDRLVEDGNTMVLLQRSHGAPQHAHRDGVVRLLHLHHLEAPGERCILLEVFLVFRPGGGGDRAQLAARQRRLEEIGRIPLAGLPAGPDQGVGLVDEEDDRHR